jgi:hypothetical protein
MLSTRAYALIQLFVLVLYLLRPIIPYVEYSINKAYIAKNLCVNKDIANSCCEGKCYLEKQVKKSADTEDKTEKNTNQKVQNKEVKEFLSSYITLPEVTVCYSVIVNSPEEKTLLPFLLVIFIPPQKSILI